MKQLSIPLFFFLLFASTTQAGTQCRARIADPQEWADATRTALHIVDELEQRNQPLALIARVGTDLGKHGIRYSHVGFVVRDHRDGRWTVLHLLNRCGSERSALYSEGLINFFADDLVSQDSRIVWLTSSRADALLQLLNSTAIHRLHEPHYNLIAHPESDHFQNSTSWALELLAASTLQSTDTSRRQAHAAMQAFGYQPYSLHIPYRKRIAGGLFAANMHFTDHSVGTRLSGNYPVVTVESIFAWLQRNGWIEASLDT